MVGRRMGHDADQRSELMRAGLAGDADAYRRCLDLLLPLVRTIVRGQLKQSSSGNSDTEDIVQETLLAIHLKRHTWRPDQPLEPWVRAIARHKVIDAFRRRGARASVPLDDVAETLAAPETAPNLAAYERDRMLDSLPARQRDIVAAFAHEGLSAREAAQRFNTSEGAIRVALHRGLKTLAARFGDKT